MNLWECTYYVKELGWYIKDWIWSTSKPSDNAIGHYWHHLFGYEITETKAYPCPEGIDTSQYKHSLAPFTQGE